MREAVETAKAVPVAGPEVPFTATEAVAAEANKRWGMPDDQAQQFFGLVYLGLERMSQRQRTMFRRAAKAAIRDLNALWPQGKSMDKIAEEVRNAQAEEAAKTQIIIPQGINADKLKESPNVPHA